MPCTYVTPIMHHSSAILNPCGGLQASCAATATNTFRARHHTLTGTHSKRTQKIISKVKEPFSQDAIFAREELGLESIDMGTSLSCKSNSRSCVLVRQLLNQYVPGRTSLRRRGSTTRPGVNSRRLSSFPITRVKICRVTCKQSSTATRPTPVSTFCCSRQPSAHPKTTAPPKSGHITLRTLPTMVAAA